jgi:ABC-2 type transport system ATP-binding protein
MTEGIEPQDEIIELPIEAAEPPAAIVGRPAIVEARGLVKRYNGTIAVAGVDLSIPEGEIFGLVGPNGAGKTTMLRMLATLLAPTSGDAEIAGESVRRNPQAVRRVLGYMPDAFGVYDDMKVWEYLDFFGRCYGLGPAQRKRMIGDLLELVDLAHKRDAYVQSLSRGMQQRLCLAHALVHDPQVLLLDEPASGLDPRARVELRELLRELRAIGKTILISSHILPELEELCTSVAIVDHGRVLAAGTINEIGQKLRVGEVLRIRVLGEEAQVRAARAWFEGREDVASASIDAGQIEIGFRGDEAGAAELLAAAVRAKIRVASYSPAATDLQELFLQVTDRDTASMQAAAQQAAAQQTGVQA